MLAAQSQQFLAGLVRSHEPHPCRTLPSGTAWATIRDDGRQTYRPARIAVAAPRRARPARRPARGLLRPRPRLPRRAAPGRGARAARRARRRRHGVRPDAGAAGRVVPRRGLRRRARRRGALGRLGGGSAARPGRRRHRGRGRAAGAADRVAPPRRRRRQRLRAVRRRPRHPRRTAGALRRVRRRGARRVRPPHRRRLQRRAGPRCCGSWLAKPRLFHTAYGAAAWEDAARRNVERELSVLAELHGSPAAGAGAARPRSR